MLDTVLRTLQVLTNSICPASDLQSQYLTHRVWSCSLYLKIYTIMSLWWLVIINYAQFGASLVTQQVKTLPAMQETAVWLLGWEHPLEKRQAPHSVFLGFPGSSCRNEFTCNSGALGLIPGSGRFLGGGHGDSLQYSCLENPQGQRSLVGYSSQGCKKSRTRLSD